MFQPPQWYPGNHFLAANLDLLGLISVSDWIFLLDTQHYTLKGRNPTKTNKCRTEVLVRTESLAEFPRHSQSKWKEGTERWTAAEFVS